MNPFANPVANQFVNRFTNPLVKFQKSLSTDGPGRNSGKFMQQIMWQILQRIFKEIAQIMWEILKNNISEISNKFKYRWPGEKF